MSPVVSSLALLTQVEAVTYGRAAIPLAVGIVLWVVNRLILRRTAATAPPTT